MSVAQSAPPSAPPSVPSAPPAARTALLPIVDGLAGPGFAHVPGPELTRALGLAAADVRAFAAFWDRLELDRHMGDGGTYRRRRYSALELVPGRPEPVLLPHGPYRQSGAVNPLNGDVDRHYAPVEYAMIASPVLRRFVAAVAASLDAVEARAERWRVRLHPYRIVAAPGIPGRPAPEGLHRDGVDFVMTLMVGCRNVAGGLSTVSDAARAPLARARLAAPLELLVVDDRRVLHDVDDVECVDPTRAGHRDVLVVAFDRFD